MLPRGFRSHRQPILLFPVEQHARILPVSVYFDIVQKHLILTQNKIFTGIIIQYNYFSYSLSLEMKFNVRKNEVLL